VQPVQIFPGVLSLILTRSARAGRTEIGGFLIGRVQNQEVLVTGATFPKQVGTPTHVVISNVEMANLAEELAERRSGEAIIGWWHTHPGIGASFMSGTDVATQRRYQAFFPKALAIVVDPMKFSESLILQDLDLHVYQLVEEKPKNLAFNYVHEPGEVIPDFYGLLLRLESQMAMPFEDTWFERMLKDVFGQRVTTPEFVETLGRFLEAAVAFSVVSVMLLIVVLSLAALVG
jgi:proteasome lid subunit RPN8/RPN11